MDLKGKRIIAIGERDGIPAPAIMACAQTAGAAPLYEVTQCFV